MILQAVSARTARYRSQRSKVLDTRYVENLMRQISRLSRPTVSLRPIAAPGGGGGGTGAGQRPAGRRRWQITSGLSASHGGARCKDSGCTYTWRTGDSMLMVKARRKPSAAYAEGGRLIGKCKAHLPTSYIAVILFCTSRLGYFFTLPTDR